MTFKQTTPYGNLPENQTDQPFTIEKIQKVYGTHFVEGNSVRLLWKDEEYFRTIIDLVNDAKDLICLQFYIFRNDETGTEMAGILRKKASEGVRVYILYDHFGSWSTPVRFWKHLRESGIQIRASRPFKWEAPFRYAYRDHRKLIIVDGEYAFTGGLNIANEYRGYHRLLRKIGWRDTGVFLRGPIVTHLLDTFRDSWTLWKGSPIFFDKVQSPEKGGLPVLPIFASSSKGRRRMRKILYYSINNARERICLTTAYFTPSRRMLLVLSDAVSRGVTVTLLLPGRSDVTAAHYAGRAFFTRLLKAGVEIYTYNGEILHAKTAVFDGVWSVVGSANLDFQSLRRNDEGNVGIVDREFASRMEEIFREDLGRSEKIVLETWRERPLSDKLKEHFYALFRRRL